MKWILFILGVIKFFILVPLTIVVIIPYFITIFFLTILGYFWKEFGSEIQEWRKKYG